MGSSIYRQVSCWSSIVTAEVHEKSLGHFGHTLPPDLVSGFQSAAHDLCSPRSDSACLLPSRLGLHSSLPGALEQLLSPTPVLPGSHWGITSLHLAHKSPSLDHIANSCPNADWLHPVPGTPPPHHLSICVFDYLSPDAMATFFQVESAQCYFLPGMADISRSLLQPQMQPWKCDFPGYHMGPAWGQPVTLLRGPTPPKSESSQGTCLN